MRSAIPACMQWVEQTYTATCSRTVKLACRPLPLSACTYTMHAFSRLVHAYRDVGERAVAMACLFCRLHRYASGRMNTFAFAPVFCHRNACMDRCMHTARCVCIRGTVHGCRGGLPAYIAMNMNSGPRCASVRLTAAEQTRQHAMFLRCYGAHVSVQRKTEDQPCLV